MGKQIRNEYFPDHVSPPGETLLETLETVGMSQAELARRTGRPTKTINEIIQGKAAITPETALQLESVFDIPARFWIRREQNYRESLARLENEKQLAAHTAWLKQVPVKAMIDLGWIQARDTDVDLLQEVLKFFGMASPDLWSDIWEKEAAFRQSSAFQADPIAVAAWLRKGELDARQITCEEYNRDVFRNTLSNIRSLTTEPPEIFQPEVVRLCAAAGVAVTFVPQLPKTRVSGATRWLTPTKALIQLSLRYKTNDHLWFTFFHEAGHILLHGKREVFLEENSGEINSKEEEANSFAANILIQPEDWRRFLALIPSDGRHISKAAIQNFSREVGIAPGIVVGRLQYEDRLPHSHCNGLKIHYEWAA